jgi:signal recognition particle subunit SRP54
MFDQLTERLGRVFANLRGHATLREDDVEAALREIRVALLEADAALDAAKALCDAVRAKASDSRVLKHLTPGQQVVKIIHEEILALLGGEAAPLRLDPALGAHTAQTVMLAGLQGSGKTTTAGKLARHLAGRGFRPFLVPLDLARPAAVEQLRKVAEAAGVPCFDGIVPGSAVETARKALEHVRTRTYDAVICDTAGRLHADEALMAEIAELKALLKPVEILYVVDAMAGQDGLRAVKAFHERLALTGAILTKLDGDARGGVALSLRHATGVPIKFAGTGEKLDAFEPFHPDRMASRILGMGDMLTLIERAAEGADEGAEERAARFEEGTMSLDDFAKELRRLKEPGFLTSMVEMLPGGGAAAKEMAGQFNPKEAARLEAVILAMTPEERRRPDALLTARRKLRVARGSGTSLAHVNRLLKRFRMAKKMMKKMKGASADAVKGMLRR